MPLINSEADKWLNYIYNLIKGLAVPPYPIPKITTSTEQWLADIYQALGGYIPPAPVNVILSDGSVAFNVNAVQVWSSAVNGQINIGSAVNRVLLWERPGVPFVSISNNTGIQISANYLGVGNEVVMESNGRITQQATATGAHNHAIGGITVGAVVPDAANYLTMEVDGVVKKIIIAV
jgi:hypothetical protein